MRSQTSNPVMPNSIRQPEEFCITKGYQQQEQAHTRSTCLGENEYWNDERIQSSKIYQYHVYRWAAELIQAHALSSLLDIGCGTGLKLQEHIVPVCNDITGIDQPAGIQAAQKLNSPGMYIEVDLERPDLQFNRSFDLMVCADVVEHLLDPDPMMDMIKELSTPQTLILFSTPDRARLHGKDCMASTKPEHVREWTASEFASFLDSRGFDLLEHRFLPADNTPIEDELPIEQRFINGQSKTSPHRCQTALCKVKA